MKKIILSVTVIAAASLTSCKKDRVCTCTYTDVTTTTTTIGGKTTTTTDTSTDAIVGTYTKARKGDAKAACASYKETKSNDPYPNIHTDSDITVDCTLK